MRPLTYAALAVLTAAGAAGNPASAAAIPAGSTVLVDRPASGPLPPDGGADAYTRGVQSVSADGNRVVFSSDADALLTAVDGSRQNTFVFVRDRAARTTTNVCRATGATGALANGDCGEPSISPNGRWVAFSSFATNLSPDDTDDTQSIYVRDLMTDETRLVSRGNNKGPSAAQFAESPSVGDNGRVAFATAEPLTVSADKNAAMDVYVRDVFANTTVLLSTSPTTFGAGNGASAEPRISGNGLSVAFSSHATDLSPADSDTARDVYTATTSGGKPRLESRAGVAGKIGNGPSFSPSLDFSGKHLVFATSASNLFPAAFGADANGSADVILRDVMNGVNTVASTRDGAGHQQFGGVADAPAISGDGTTASFVVSGSSAFDERTLYVRRPATDTTTIASRRDGPDGAVLRVSNGGLSGAGDVAVMSGDITGVSGGLSNHVAVRDLSTSATALVSVPTGADTVEEGAAGAYFVGQHGISGDGRYVVFLGFGRGLTPSASGGAHIYRRDLATGEVRLVDGADAELDRRSTDGEDHSMSGDGERVAYLGAPDGGTGAGKIVIRDLRTGTAQIIAPRDGGVKPTTELWSMTLSGDGTKLGLVTDDALDQADTNTGPDLYVLDVSTGLVTLGSRVDGPSGAASGISSSTAVLSRDGGRVAFSATGKGVAPGDTTNTGQVFVRDLATGSTVLASRSNGADGTEFDADAYVGDLSADGNRVSMMSAAVGVGDGDTDASSDVHVRDLRTGQTLWASPGLGGAQSDGDANGGSLSADGARVAFSSGATNLVPGDTNAGSSNDGNDTFLHDFGTGSTTRVSVTSGGQQATGNLGYTPALSTEGHCVLFFARSVDLVPGGYLSLDQGHLYARAVDADCPGATPSATPAPTPTATPGPGPDTTGQEAKPVGKVTPDRTAPVVSRLALSRKAFTARGKKAGTVLSFTLSEAATAKITIVTSAPGRRKGRACVAESRIVRAKRAKAKRCTRYGKPQPIASRALATGRATVKITGRVGKRTLRRGRYRLLVTATDAAGNTTLVPAGIDTRVK